MLYSWLKEIGEKVYYYSGNLTQKQVLFMSPDLIVSYNYSKLIAEDIIRLNKGKIVNLHISYLPWNRGSDPNFWSFIENTPKGVTIHEMISELDQGDILLQKEIFFDEDFETFQTSYDVLNREIVKLFKDHFLEIKTQKLRAHPQDGEGSCHKRKDFINFTENKTFAWTETITGFKRKYGIPELV